MKKNRIWELDALRGIMILCVVAIHLIFDLDEFLGIDVIKNPVLQYCADHFGVTFVILSGLCVTLGRHPFKRGMQVFGCGMVITAVTVGAVLLGWMDKWLIIHFGILHLLGVCMMLWCLFRQLPVCALIPAGISIVLLGKWFDTLTVSSPWLFPLGLCAKGFASGDYFPLFPFLGWFLLGAALGKLLYRKKQTLLPWKGADWLPVRFFRFCGVHSLFIYLIHQPVLYGIVMLLSV